MNKLNGHHIKETDLAYLAGIIDADGCIGVSIARPNKKAKRINPSFRARIKIAMCDREALDLFVELFGGNITKVKRANPKWNDIYELQSHSKTCKSALVKLLPFLRIKVEQAKLAITLIDRVSAYAITEKGHCGVKRIDKQELSKRIEIANKFKVLNATGPK